MIKFILCNGFNFWTSGSLSFDMRCSRPVVYHGIKIDVVYKLYQMLSLLLNFFLLPGNVEFGNKFSNTSEVKNIRFSGSMEDKKGSNLVQASSSDSPTSSVPIASNFPSNVKSAALAGPNLHPVGEIYGHVNALWKKLMSSNSGDATLRSGCSQEHPDLKFFFFYIQ